MEENPDQKLAAIIQLDLHKEHHKDLTRAHAILLAIEELLPELRRVVAMASDQAPVTDRIKAS